MAVLQKNPKSKQQQQQTNPRKKKRVPSVIPSGGIEGVEVKAFLDLIENSESGGLTFIPSVHRRLGGDRAGRITYRAFDFTSSGALVAPSAPWVPFLRLVVLPRAGRACPFSVPPRADCGQPGAGPRGGDQAAAGGAPARSGLRRRGRWRGEEGARRRRRPGCERPRPRTAAG